MQANTVFANACGDMGSGSLPASLVTVAKWLLNLQTSSSDSRQEEGGEREQRPNASPHEALSLLWWKGHLPPGLGHSSQFQA